MKNKIVNHPLFQTSFGSERGDMLPACLPTCKPTNWQLVATTLLLLFTTLQAEDATKLQLGELFDPTILVDTSHAVESAIYETRSVSKENNFWEFAYSQGKLEGAKTSIELQKKTAAVQYEWGSVKVTYSKEGNALLIKLAMTNQAEEPIANFRLRLAKLRLTGIPEGLVDKKTGTPKLLRSLNRPLAIGFGAKDKRVYASYETFWPPVQFGLGKPEGAEKDVYPLIVTGGVMDAPKDSMTIPSMGIPTIPPGETLELEFGLRLADRTTPRNVVLQDFYRKFRKHVGPAPDWPDRRPVGATYLMNEWGKRPPMAGVAGTNPRRWWSAMLDTVDVFSPQGRDLIRKAMHGWAQATITALKFMDGQGVILWNLEGAYQSTGFVGDPRMLPITNPEMEEGVDDYFRIVREAGYRVGCTIRHPQPRWSGDDKRGRWVQGIGNLNPHYDYVKDEYAKILPKHHPWWTVYPIARRLSDKIAYAKKRWGCTLFYYDTSLVMRFYWKQRALKQRQALAELLCHLVKNANDEGTTNVSDDQLLDFMEKKGFERNTYLVNEVRGILQRHIKAETIILKTAEFILKQRGKKEERIDLRAADAPKTLVARKVVAGGSQGVINTAVNEWIWRKIRKDHPDVYIFPEIFQRGGPMPTALHYIAPYGQTGFGRARPIMGSGKTGDSDFTRDLVPGYFGFNYIHDTGGDPFVPRVDRINEICWGEIMAVDGWGRGLKQRAIQEHTRHANDKLRRVIALARRFNLIKRPDEVLPLPYALENATPIPAQPLLADHTGLHQLRPHTASSKDRREAALLLPWYGWPYSPHTNLKAGLPGVDVTGKHRAVWDIETGHLLNTPEGHIHVPAAPATMFRACYVRGIDTPPRPAPRGISLALSFDKGAAPDFGGGLLKENGKISTSRGASGKALVIQPGSSAAKYGVVPSWFSGTIEFDLRIEQPADAGKPSPLVRMKHHMETTLWLSSKEGRPALKLETWERNSQSPGYHLSGYAPRTKPRSPYPEGPMERIGWAALPTDGKWHRIVLAWELGQYRLYVNGERQFLLSNPTTMRWRDGTIFEPGLILGGGEGTAKAAIDSFIHYDWSFGDTQAKTRTAGTGFKHLNRPDDLKPSVYLWGSEPEKTERIMVNFRRSPNGRRGMGVNASLSKVMKGGTQELSSGKARIYRGIATVILKYEPKAPPVESKDAKLEADADDIEELDKLLDGEIKFILKVNANAAGENPPDREITFTYGEDKEHAQYFE